MAAERKSKRCAEKAAAQKITKKRARREDPSHSRTKRASDKELAAEIVRAHGIKPALLKQVLAFKRRLEASLENHSAEGSCRPPFPKIPTVGSTCCSGLYTGGFAMRADKFDHVTEFVAETQPHLRSFIKEKFPGVKRVFSDCTSRKFTQTRLGGIAGAAATAGAAAAAAGDPRSLKSQPIMEAIFDADPTLATYRNYPMPAAKGKTKVRTITAALKAVDATAQ